MLEGMFVTVAGFSSYHGAAPFAIGARFICIKEPDNKYDDDAIAVVGADGEKLGYLANNAGTKANGTMSASRIYDRVGKRFVIEVCFTTRTKIICHVVNTDCDM